jgi:iron complex outermembrane receptor protein
MMISKTILCASILAGLGLVAVVHAQDAAAPPQVSPTQDAAADKTKTPGERAEEKQAKVLQTVTVAGYRQSLSA